MSTTGKNHPKVQAFLDDLQAVYRKHGMSLAHEDSHGAFHVEPYDPVNVDWLNDARLVNTRVVHEADAWIESQWMNGRCFDEAQKRELTARLWGVFGPQ